MKIQILGHSGCGKSTLGRQLASHYNIPCLHLDSVYFMEDWEGRGTDEACQIIADFLEKQSGEWVIEGNYHKFLLNERLEQADMIVYLNYNRFLCFYRAFMRSVQYRGVTRPDMSAGCIEKFDWEFAKWLLYNGRGAKHVERLQCVKPHEHKTRHFGTPYELRQFLTEQGISQDGNQVGVPTVQTWLDYFLRNIGWN
eukprot:TRINITY_DN7369_c0_g1_i1.p1 TRINITY_DN7369_c0_g1~~TRINITY_DN7369_c0_g1_i1.p1  ORF type:complete len:197 (+),score=16.16 TRINITY_DN7369_c0_g1_i1:38-628(+)